MASTKAYFMGGPEHLISVFVGTSVTANDVCIIGSTGSLTGVGVAHTDADSYGLASVNIAPGAIYQVNDVSTLDSAGSACSIDVGEKLYARGSGATVEIAKSSTGVVLFGRNLGVSLGGLNPSATQVAACAVYYDHLVQLLFS